jgi:hypothetical protein
LDQHVRRSIIALIVDPPAVDFPETAAAHPTDLHEAPLRSQSPMLRSEPTRAALSDISTQVGRSIITTPLHGRTRPVPARRAVRPIVGATTVGDRDIERLETENAPEYVPYLSGR